MLVGYAMNENYLLAPTVNTFSIAEFSITQSPRKMSGIELDELIQRDVDRLYARLGKSMSVYAWHLLQKKFIEGR